MPPLSQPALFDKKKVIDSLKSLRRSQAITGYKVYEGDFPIYLNALPDFFTQTGEVKPEYKDALDIRMKELGLSYHRISDMDKQSASSQLFQPTDSL